MYIHDMTCMYGMYVCMRPPPTPAERRGIAGPRGGAVLRSGQGCCSPPPVQPRPDRPVAGHHFVRMTRRRSSYPWMSRARVGRQLATHLLCLLSLRCLHVAQRRTSQAQKGFNNFAGGQRNARGTQQYCAYRFFFATEKKQSTACVPNRFGVCEHGVGWLYHTV